jgi:hypothetical protein
MVQEEIKRANTKETAVIAAAGTNKESNEKATINNKAGVTTGGRA